MFGSPDKVPEMVRPVVLLVMLSVLEVPVSSAAARSTVPAVTVGLVVSTVIESGSDFGLS